MAERRTIVSHVEAAAGSERRACRWLGWHRSPIRYVATRGGDDTTLRQRLRELASRHPRWGSPLLIWRLRQEGITDNHKRVRRLYRLEGLAVRRQRRKWVAWPRVVHPAATAPTEQWAMDFVRDTLADGRSFRAFTVVDTCTRECVAIEVDVSLSGERVVRVLERLGAERGRPRGIQRDNGPELQSRALDAWAHQRQVQLQFIQPGKPVQHCFTESFNGRLRDECLNQHWFLSLADARRTIERWRVSCNTDRPHRGLGGRTPAQRAEELQGKTLTRLSA